METAEALRTMLLEISGQGANPDLSDTSPVLLDLSEVDVCGTAGVQLLLSAQRTMASKGVSIQAIAPAPSVEQAFSRFGTAYPFSTSEQTGAPVQ